MLEKLLNLETYEQMRSFVQDITNQANITVLVKEMKSSGISFTQEILSTCEHNDFAETAKLNKMSGVSESVLCYRKLIWVMKTNPIVSIKIQQLIEMFKA